MHKLINERQLALAIGVSRGKVALVAAELGIKPTRKPMIFEKLYSPNQAKRIADRIPLHKRGERRKKQEEDRT